VKTARTVLRRVRADDLANIRELESDPLVMRYTSMGRALSEDESRERLRTQIARGDGDFGIWLAEALDGRFIGWFMLKPNEDSSLELGFMIVQKMWGQGLTTEIAMRLVDHARSQGRTLVAKTNIDNAVSMKVLEKLGFRLVETGSINVYRL
jgi:RimJ/RimL family protein N-acetyltransferase